MLNDVVAFVTTAGVLTAAAAAIGPGAGTVAASLDLTGLLRASAPV